MAQFYEFLSNNSQVITKDMITGALDASMTIDNRLFTSSGRASIASDFSNLGTNLVKATVGALGTATSVFTATYQVLSDDDKSITDVVSQWESNQTGMATSILRGSSETVSNIITKVKAGTATPEEIQTLLSYTSNGEYNLAYSEDGEITMNGEVVLGANDTSTAQGYVNLANGNATDAEKLLFTDAHETSHDYTDNEAVVDTAATGAVLYYNIVAGLTGNETTGTSTGGYGTTTQANWNSTYNTSTSTLLAVNTAKYNTVSGSDKDYSTFVTKTDTEGKYKVVYAENDGDKNVYVVDGEATKEDIEENKEDYEKEQLKNEDTGNYYQTYSAGEFDNYSCNGDVGCYIYTNLKIDFEGIAEGANKLGGLFNLALESKTGGAYDLKNSLQDGYTSSVNDGVVNYNDSNIIMNVDTAGNYLYGVTTKEFGIGTYEKAEWLADAYHNFSNSETSGETSRVKSIIEDGYNSTTKGNNSGLNLIDLRIRINKDFENVKNNIK